MQRGLFALALAASLMVAGAAHAQERIQTNLRGVTTSAAPPAAFDYKTASDADLALYGLPPRPDEFSHSALHAAWTRAMAASKMRVVPQLQMTDTFHGPHRVANSNGTSNNWSGAVSLTAAKAFNETTSFHYIGMEWVVPVARQAYGVCNGGWDYSSTWAGFDGYGSPDVLQAGTESDAYCAGNATQSYYSAWYEWFPYGSVRITNFPIAPGDDMFVEIWNTSATQGHVYFVNYTTDQAIELSFNAPPGTALVGNSAEWVVERPEVSGGLATLTNYIAEYVSGCLASTWGGQSVYPGQTSALVLTMVDTNSQPISTAIVLGGYCDVVPGSGFGKMTPGKPGSAMEAAR